MLQFKSMKDAPKDREIYILAVDPCIFDPMPPIIARTQWHPDAGYCVCTIREEVGWLEVDELRC